MSLFSWSSVNWLQPPVPGGLALVPITVISPFPSAEYADTARLKPILKLPKSLEFASTRHPPDNARLPCFDVESVTIGTHCKFLGGTRGAL